MVKESRKFIKRIMTGVAFVMMFAFFTAKPVLPGIGIFEPKKVPPSYKMDRAEEAYRILAVLEKEDGGRKLSARAKDKILSLNREQTRLIVSLCDRLAENGHTAGGDIAYLLITALIVLS